MPFWPEWIKCFLLLYYCFLQLLFGWIFFVLQRTKNNPFLKHSDIYNISKATLLKFMCLILFILVVILPSSCQENCKTTKKPQKLKQKQTMKFSQSSSHKNMEKTWKKHMYFEQKFKRWSNKSKSSYKPLKNNKTVNLTLHDIWHTANHYLHFIPKHLPEKRSWR